MDRRTFIKGVSCASAGAYIWIPRISIAKINGDAREAVFKSREVLVDNFEFSNTSTVQNALKNTAYSSYVSNAKNKMSERNYTKTADSANNFYISPNRNQAMFGVTKSDNVNYCNSYYRADRSNRDAAAYITSVGIIAHSILAEKARKHWTLSRTVDWLYPYEYTELFNAEWGDEVRTPVRVICESGIWTFDFRRSDYGAGFGQIAMLSRDDLRYIYRESFEVNVDL